MNTYINQIKAWLDAYQAEDGTADMDGMLEVLYDHYLEHPSVPTQEVKSLSRQLNDCLSHLCFQDSDCVWTLVNRLCSAQEQAAFLAGARVGATLILELTADGHP